MTDDITTLNDDGTEPGKPKGRYMAGGAVAACAVCCAPPVLALVGIVVAAISVGAFIFRRRTPKRSKRPHATTRPDALEQSPHGPSPLPDPVRRSSIR